MHDNIIRLLDAIDNFDGGDYQLHKIDAFEKSIFVLPIKSDMRATVEDKAKAFEAFARTIIPNATIKLTSNTDAYYHYQTELFDGWVLKTCVVWFGATDLLI